jgi:hypothetical protein
MMRSEFGDLNVATSRSAIWRAICEWHSTKKKWPSKKEERAH